MSNRKYCIYYHKSLDGRYYIGQTCQEVEDRWQFGNGYHSSKFNKEVILKNGGWDSFEHGILESNIDEREVDEKEAYYISLYKADSEGFNTYKQNYSRYHFADLWADEVIRNNIILKLKEQRNTLEYKQQKSEQMKNLWKDKNYRKKQEEAKEERIRKLSIKSKELWKDEDYRKKIANAQSEYRKKDWENPKYRQKMCKQVRCIETGQIFESIKLAAEWCGVKPNSLCSALSSKTHQSGKHPETGIKLHWERYPVEVGKEG